MRQNDENPISQSAASDRELVSTGMTAAGQENFLLGRLSAREPNTLPLENGDHASIAMPY